MQRISVLILYFATLLNWLMRSSRFLVSSSEFSVYSIMSPTKSEIFFSYFIYLFFFLLYNIVLVLPYINMHPPWVYTCSYPETPSHRPPHTIPIGHPSAPAPSLHISFLLFPSLSLSLFFFVLAISYYSLRWHILGPTRSFFLEDRGEDISLKEWKMNWIALLGKETQRSWENDLGMRKPVPGEMNLGREEGWGWGRDNDRESCG